MSAVTMAGLVALCVLVVLLGFIAGYALVKDMLSPAARAAAERVARTPIAYVVMMACLSVLALMSAVSSNWLGVGIAGLGMVQATMLHLRRAAPLNTRTKAEPHA